MDKPRYIAVDGGGTRCRVAVALGDSRHETEAGPANVSTALDAALAEIHCGIDALAQRFGQERRNWRSVPIYLGLAGVIGPVQVDGVAEQLDFDHVLVEDDRPAAVHGALGVADGAVLHCGTGSFQAIQREGRIRTVGGWGAVLGDPASAMWLGREALTATLAAHDGLHATTALSASLSTRFGGATGVVAFARDASPAEFGALAPTVTQAAEAGDEMAQQLMQRGANEQVHVLDQLGWDRETTVCLTGGLAAHYRGYFPAHVQRAIQPLRGSTLDGAFALAQRFAEACAR